MRPGDDLPDVEIGISYWKTLGLLVVSAALWLMTATALFQWLPFKAPANVSAAAGYCGFMLFGVGTYMFAWQLLQPSRTVLVVNRYGVRDLRTSFNLIPWQSVGAIDTWQSRSSKYVVLKLTPAARDRFAAAGVLQAAMAFNKMFGLDGIPIRATMLTVSPEELLNICNTYLAAARGSETSSAAVPSAQAGVDLVEHR
ncbi:hypothetical protein ACVIHI_004557 [Bradyrhizobium sp. USDA 4524]|uniref:STM3941 family protein n=1 Tax=unclassified Bradyrhizobium TaxID=2631580 RepID=UPI00209EE746|nr:MULTISPECIES: STM3941 family protein [unclassified Bradyrhizobium]MCP1842526.1 hypothetical protein [Bradyrhizobium sp. USDA 4538]MCP1903090.1 hypothetical protein [Bradyrhizobium sp. USDA 4537]MCP1991253.1 hypothetical protein [Bradyrhizobium sp. USDA 4539]